jgi:predicted hydrocarbon binding protein
MVSRPLAFRQTRRLAHRYFNGSMERVGSFVLLAVTDSPTAGAAPNSVGCAYFESSLGVILQKLLDTGGRVEHVRCIDRGDGVCQWRADWRQGR